MLEDINLSIPHNRVTAIVGASGSGKTTIVKLLLGFYNPNKGDVRIGDTSLKNLNPHVWRSKTGSVMQDGFIFSDTIANNIAPGEEVVDKERLLHAVTVANIRDFIDSLPLGCLVEGRKLILGGVEVPFEKGLLGHSDADVLAHAVMDAVLGAAALGDIGQHFPDNDPAYAGADSLALLREVTARLHAAGYTVGNLDCTVLAQAPKLAPHIAQMRRNLAQCMDVDVDRVSVKATTEEGLGFTGTREGIAAHAVVLIERIS